MTELEMLGYASEKDRVRAYLVSALQHLTNVPPEHHEMCMRLAAEEIEAVLSKYLEKV